MKFKNIISKVIEKDKNFKSKKFKLSRLIINTLFKTMAYKDEFEVARLYTDGRFEKYLNENFEGNFKLGIYLSPPILNLKTQNKESQKKSYLQKKFLSF